MATTQRVVISRTPPTSPMLFSVSLNLWGAVQDLATRKGWEPPPAAQGGHLTIEQATALARALGRILPDIPTEPAVASDRPTGFDRFRGAMRDAVQGIIDLADGHAVKVELFGGQ